MTIPPGEGDDLTVRSASSTGPLAGPATRRSPPGGGPAGAIRPSPPILVAPEAFLPAAAGTAWATSPPIGASACSSAGSRWLASCSVS